MINNSKPINCLLLIIIIPFSSSILYAQLNQPPKPSSDYQELVDLFFDWREFRAWIDLMT